LSLACAATSQVLGGSVDVPMSFSRCGHSSLGAICIMAFAVGVGIIWVAADCHCRSSFACVTVSQKLGLLRVSLVFIPCIILSNPSFATRYPSSQPKSIPLSIPSFRPNFFPSINPNFLEGCRVWQPTLDLGFLRDRIKLSSLHGSRNQ
jgi:hypothetical protein